MPVVLGLDYGDQRIGVAIADESMPVATPHTVLPSGNRKKVLEGIQGLLRDFVVSKIVVGLPRTLKGEMGPAAQKITREVEWLRKEIPVEWLFWDERLTTREVDRLLSESEVSISKRKAVRDSLAAQRILQSYLDFNRFQKPAS